MPLTLVRRRWSESPARWPSGHIVSLRAQIWEPKHCHSAGPSLAWQSRARKSIITAATSQERPRFDSDAGSAGRPARPRHPSRRPGPGRTSTCGERQRRSDSEVGGERRRVESLAAAPSFHCAARLPSPLELGAAEPAPPFARRSCEAPAAALRSAAWAWPSWGGRVFEPTSFRVG